MAQDLRSRRANAGCALSRRRPLGRRLLQSLLRRTATPLAAALATVAAAATGLLASACGGPEPAAARTVPSADLDPATLIDAVLDECHRPLRGKADRVAATVELPDGRSVQLFAQLPHDLRTQGDGEILVLRGERAARLAGGDASVRPEELQRLRQLRTLLDAATLGPLHRATACSRLGPQTFALAQANGAAIELALRPDTLLPSRLFAGDDAVQLHDYLHTAAGTWLVQTAESKALGRCKVRLDTGGIAWNADFFALPGEVEKPAAGKRVVGPGVQIESRSPTPILVEVATVRWVVVDDPGDWAARAASYTPLHEELQRQQQAIAGFPVLFRDDDRARLAAPFRQRANGPALSAPAGWQLREFAAGKWLVVYPAVDLIGGDLTARLAAGERMLRDAAATQGLTPRGPVTAQPHFHLEEGAPAADKLAAPIVRMALPVQ